MRAVLGGESGAVGAEHHLICDVDALALVERPVDRAPLNGVGLAVRAGVVDEPVDLLT